MPFYTYLYLSICLYLFITHTQRHILLLLFSAAAAAAKSLQSCPILCNPPRRQSPRLPRPWDSPGKNTGVGCHFLLQCMKVKTESEVAQSCPTLCDPMDCSLPGFSVHGIFQASVLEWGAIALRYKICDSLHVLVYLLYLSSVSCN